MILTELSETAKLQLQLQRYVHCPLRPIKPGGGEGEGWGQFPDLSFHVENSLEEPRFISFKTAPFIFERTRQAITRSIERNAHTSSYYLKFPVGALRF